MKRLRSQLQKIDTFGAPVTVNYRGKDTFPTSFGGILTLLMAVYMTYYTTICIVKVLSFKDSKISSYMIKDDRDDMEDPMNLQENGFDLVFGFADAKTWNVKELDPRIGAFEMFEATRTPYEGNTAKIIRKVIPVIQRDLSKEESSEKWGVYQNSTVNSANYTNVSVQYARQAPKRKALMLRITRCTFLKRENITCASEQEIEAFFKKNFFFLFTVDNFVDMETVGFTHK